MAMLLGFSQVDSQTQYRGSRVQGFLEFPNYALRQYARKIWFPCRDFGRHKKERTIKATKYLSTGPDYKY